MFLTRFRLPKISLSLSKFLQMKLNSFLFRFLPFSSLPSAMLWSWAGSTISCAGLKKP